MGLLKKIGLRCTNGNSNKFYNVCLFDRADQKFDVLCEWGRIGSSPQQRMYATAVSLEAAIEEMRERANGKVKKGYIANSPDMRDLNQGFPALRGQATKAPLIKSKPMPVQANSGIFAF